MSDADVFTDDVVVAVVRHLNDDHADHCRDIVRVLGGVDADHVTAVSVDADGIEFRAHHAGTPDETVRLPWGGPIVARGDIRAEVVRMYERAEASPR